MSNGRYKDTGGLSKEHVCPPAGYSTAELTQAMRLARAQAMLDAADRLCRTGTRCPHCGGFASVDGTLRVWARESLQERP